MTAASSPIEAHEQTLKRIFSDEYIFEIPPYQRPYAWEVEQATQLLTDLRTELDQKETGTYFLGSVVIIKDPNRSKSLVVDGQQRLTTLTILLSIIRDLTSIPKVRMSRAQLVMQLEDQDAGVQQGCRLHLRDEDQAFFQKTIQVEGATDHIPDPKHLKGAQQRIAENARALRSALESMSPVARDDLMGFILRHCYLVVVAVPTPDSARRIFTVLNARGLDLTPTDILKASLLERIRSEKAQKQAADRWDTVENALGRDGMVELFGHIRMIHERDKPRSALDTAFPKVVKSFVDGSPEDFLGNVLEPLAASVLLLQDTHQVAARFGPEVARSVRSLDRIDSKDWLPPAILRLWKSAADGEESAGAFLIGLERLAYYLFVTRQGINERIARFVAVMDEFDPRKSVDPAKTAQPANGLALSDAEKKAFRAELDGPLYLKTRVCKPVLQRLDEALSSLGATYEGTVSIEHVLPQTVEDTSEWAALFPVAADRDAWTHRLANLVFLTRSINSRASNWDFKRKKVDYFMTRNGRVPFPITQTVLDAPDWTVDRLQDRQAQFLAHLAKVWAL